MRSPLLMDPFKEHSAKLLGHRKDRERAGQIENEDRAGRQR